MADRHHDHSGAITLPPVLFLTAFAVGLGLDHMWPASFLPEGIQVVLAAALMAASAIIVLFTARMFFKHDTTIHVHRATTALITGGPFKFSRNPAYVALVLLYLGAAVAVDSAWVVAMVVPAVAALHYGVIVREERYLERIFGDDYRWYRSRVRRWL